MKSDDIEKLLDIIGHIKRQAKSNKEKFSSLECYCMFIGYPRSGHSLTGSLLDAHPDMTIGHEVDAMRCMIAGFTRDMILYLLRENARAFTQDGREWNDYSYQVANQWQGRNRTLKVIGDKKGGNVSLHLMRNPRLFDDFAKLIGLPIKLIHVIRNPYDNISTMSKKHEMDLGEAVGQYFARVQSVQALKSRLGDSAIVDVWHEDFVANPQTGLAALCNFLGQPAEPDYIEDCSAIVFKSPKQSRHEAPWTPELIASVRKSMESVPFLQRYSFEN